MDRRSLQSAARWADLAAVAVHLAERGWFEDAHEWSQLVAEAALPGMFTGPPEQHHGGLAVICENKGDTSVCSPLALIDFLAGDSERAAKRAHEFGRRDFVTNMHGWNMVVDEAVVEWVTARLEPDPDARRQRLEAIHHRHSWLGLLQAQIEADLAELARQRGDCVEAAERDERAQSALESPHPNLHLTNYCAYYQLLRQLPFPRSVRLSAASPPGTAN